jgi:hypothetical protein
VAGRIISTKFNLKTMGYYTRHELTIIDGEDFNINYEQEIADSTDYNDLFDDSIKWYDCEKDMREFSKKYPNTTFLIDGEGEESGDIWKSYFKNGKMFTAKATMVFEEFSIEKLS